MTNISNMNIHRTAGFVQVKVRPLLGTCVHRTFLNYFILITLYNFTVPCFAFMLWALYKSLDMKKKSNADYQGNVDCPINEDILLDELEIVLQLQSDLRSCTT